MIDVDNELAKNIKARMVKKGMNQNELAQKAGTTPQYISAILKGKPVGRKVLERIAKALDTTPGELLIMSKHLRGGVLIPGKLVKIYPRIGVIIDQLEEVANENMKASEVLEYIIHLLEAELVRQKRREHKKAHLISIPSKDNS